MSAEVKRLAPESQWEAVTVRRGQLWRKHRLAVIGATILLIVMVAAVLAPLLTPCDPLAQNLVLRLKPPGFVDASGVRHWLGTDGLGRDILSRLMYGARVSLLVGSLSVAIAGAGGLLLGLAAGFLGGGIDALIMRIVDLQLAFPFILLALAIIALLGPSLRNVILVFAVTSWPLYARVVRSAVLVVKEREYVEAARATGMGEWRILLRHVTPNVLGPLIVLASYQVAQMIILEAALGFLGLSVPPPTPTWGNMLADGRDYIQDAWWLATFPGLAIMFTAVGINLLGDGLSDWLDPRITARGR